jgi:toxin ParE1/3/4
VKSKLIFPRESASRDVVDAVDYYLNEAGEQIALDFVESLEQAYLHLSSHPTSGSPRYVHELNLPGLRSWPLQRYPYLIFYVERPNHIDIWRVLHGQRDISAWLRDDTDTGPDKPHWL